MRLALFLHLYQPPTQFAKVLKDISDSSYRRLLNIIREYLFAKLTLNISGSLTEQLAAHSGLRGLITEFADLARTGQIELVGSAAYHPLLTEIPVDEVKRQILLNDEINRKHFGDAYQPKGFFPPEMAVNSQVLEVVRELGFEWVVVDESAVVGAGEGKSLALKPSSERGSEESPAVSSLRLFVRNTNLSVKVAFSQIRTLEELKKEVLAKELSAKGYVLLAMDGETFGHHRPEQIELLKQLFAASSTVRLVSLSELLKTGAEVEVQESSWGPWERWKNPDNPIHQFQWQLTNLAMETVQSSKFKIKSCNSKLKVKEKIFNFSLSTFNLDRYQSKLTPDQRQWLKARNMLDRSLHSDQFWWASATPCWHYQMVERGARMLRDVVLAVPDAPEVSRREAKQLYEQIISTGKKLHGECVIEG